MNDLHKKIKSEYLKESLPIRLVFMIILTAPHKIMVNADKIDEK